MTDLIAQKKPPSEKKLLIQQGELSDSEARWIKGYSIRFTNATAVCAYK